MDGRRSRRRDAVIAAVAVHAGPVVPGNALVVPGARGNPLRDFPCRAGIVAVHVQRRRGHIVGRNAPVPGGVGEDELDEYIVERIAAGVAGFHKRGGGVVGVGGSAGHVRVVDVGSSQGFRGGGKRDGILGAGVLQELFVQRDGDEIVPVLVLRHVDQVVGAGIAGGVDQLAQDDVALRVSLFIRDGDGIAGGIQQAAAVERNTEGELVLAGVAI